jgi:tetratricopeptide (TPR) repeat protein
MDEAKYQALLEALAEVETRQALGELVVRHPELMDPAFARWAKEALSRWESGKAARLRKNLELLAMLREALGKGEARRREENSPGMGAIAEAAALLEAIPAHIPPSQDPRAAWARPFRQFLALTPNNSEPLQEALRLAQGASEPAIVAWLELIGQKSWRQAKDQAYELAVGLHRAERSEEAYTVLLLPIALEAFAVDLAVQAPVPRRQALLQKALHFLGKGLELAASLQDEPCTALFLALQGLGFQQLEQLESAVEAYQHAVAIYHPLAQQHPEFEPDLAKTLANLGNVLSDLGRFDPAMQAYEGALRIYRPLAQQHPQYEPDLAATLNNLGVAYRGLRRFDEAVQAYEEGLGIYRRLAQQQPEVYEADVAMTLDNLGNALQGLRRFDEAVQAYEEGLGIYRRLAQQQPEVYEADVAMTLDNLGNALRPSPLRRGGASVRGRLGDLPSPGPAAARGVRG